MPPDLSSRPAPASLDPAATPVPLRLPHGRIVAACWVTALVVAGMSLVVNWQRYHGGHGNMLGFVNFFDVDHEQSVPTFFSVCLLLGTTVILACIATLKRQQADRFAMHWRWLALGFFALAFDEVAGLHEKLTPFTHWLMAGYPLAPRSWTLVGMVVAATVAAIYFPFLRHFPFSTRSLIVAAGVTYLGGTIGMEVIGGAHVRVHGLDYTYAVNAVIEEGMENAGIVLFLDAMLGYYASLGATVLVAVAPRRPVSEVVATVRPVVAKTASAPPMIGPVGEMA